jgi:tetratricopeptide (TPR) repeat protein/TolB-like protein
MASQPVSGRVLGHYRLLERVGEGGMGVVYRAYDEHLQREIAVKLLPSSVVKDESARRRFRKEALTLARLNHPNIGTLHGFEADGDVDFLVMEYVPGITLASKLAQGPMRESELLEYAIQLASALEEAHKQGVIHRDLKPSNILINPSGQVKILDFGLARLLTAGDDSDTDTGNLTVAGTLPYVSPEELSGVPALDNRSDLYSFGVMLYEMATGKRPHSETSVAALLAAILHREPALVRSLNAAISPELETIIRKAMDKDAALRYQSAREMKVDLQRLVSGRKLESWPTAPLPAASRTNWLTPVLVVLLAVAVSLGFVALRWRARRSAAVLVAPRVVAVLPFDAIGGDRENQVLCRGLTELLTTRLTQISKQYGVEVVPASEVRTQNVTSVGDAQKKLGVNLVVEGSWDFAGNQVMYSLVNAQSRRNLSAESVRADVNNLMAVESQVTDSLLTMLAGEMRPGEARSADHNPQPPDSSSVVVHPDVAHPDAYQYYVRGVGYLSEYQNADSLQAAVSLFRAALDRDPNFALAQAGTAEAYWRLFQETKDQSWIPKALDAAHRAAELNDQLAPVHTTVGLIDQGQGKYDDAVKEFQRALELDATSDAAYRGLASTYEAAGKNADAESTYRRAIDLRKDYWGGYSALGAFYAKNARYEDAATQFRRVIELAPENVRGYANLGAIYVLQGKLPQAEETLQKSLSIEPNYRAYANLATMYFDQGRYSDSADMFDKALQLNDKDARVWRNLGDAYYWTPSEREKSAPAYQHAAGLLDAQRKINPQDTKLMVELALCDSTLGKQTQAIALIRQARSHAPADPEIMFRTAEIYQQGGDHAAALDWLDKAARAGYSVADIQHDPTFQGIRDDPRYKQIVQQPPAQPPAK